MINMEDQVHQRNDEIRVSSTPAGTVLAFPSRVAPEEPDNHSVSSCLTTASYLWGSGRAPTDHLRVSAISSDPHR